SGWKRGGVGYRVREGIRCFTRAEKFASSLVARTVALDESQCRIQETNGNGRGLHNYGMFAILRLALGRSPVVGIFLEGSAEYSVVLLDRTVRRCLAQEIVCAIASQLFSCSQYRRSLRTMHLSGARR